MTISRRSRKIGEQSQATNSVNLSLTARLRTGLVLQGGFNTFKTDSDSCDLRRKIPESAPTNPWCDTSTGWVTRVTALGTYTIPKVDVQVAGTFRSDQGASLGANWVAPNSATVGLGRPFAGVAGQTITVNLVEPGTLYGDRVNQFDLRFVKILRFGRTRTSVGFDVIQHGQRRDGTQLSPDLHPERAVSTWLRPTSVLQWRFVKVSAQIDV